MCVYLLFIVLLDLCQKYHGINNDTFSVLKGSEYQCFD